MSENPKGTSEIVVSGLRRDYQFKLCKCCVCGVVARCTPSFDFYTIPDDYQNLLYCEKCLEESTRPISINLITFEIDKELEGLVEQFLRSKPPRTIERKQ